MTLPELLVCVAVMGLVTAVISAAIVVTLRQQASAEGRLNLAVAEQNIDVWLPTDLASAASVSTSPDANPCGDSEWCGGVELATGSMALMLSWSTRTGEESVTTTTVGYHFAPAGDGTYSLTRIECVDGSCKSHVVLRDLKVPIDPVTGLPLWSAGDQVPPEVINVTNPLRFDDDDEMDDSENTKNARRVVVTINGGGTGGGSSGGSNEVSITAGGTARGTLPARAAYQMPSLVQPRSRCGGPMALLIDESSSLQAAGVDAVRAGVVDFIEALDGTPVQLMIVPFNDRARALGAGNAYPEPYKWHRYFSMDDPAQVDLLRRLVTTQPTVDGTPDDQIEMRGVGPGESMPSIAYTNWEDAWFRTFFNSVGQPATVMPNTVVFFTDGVPTRDRAYSASAYKHDTAGETLLPPGNWGSDTNQHWGNNIQYFSNAAFQRADAIASGFRGAVRLIGVAVGPDVPKYSNLVTGSPAWERHTDTSSDRPFERRNSNGTYSNLASGTYRTSELSTDREKAQSTWTAVSSPPSSWESNRWYQLDGTRTPNSTIVGRLVAGNEIVPFETNAKGDFTNLETGNLFSSPDWDALAPALQKIALGQCGGTISVQTRRGAWNGETVSTTFSYMKVGEYYDAAGTNPVPGALVGTTVSTNSVQKTVTIDMNLDDGLNRYVDLVPQGVSSLSGLTYKEWVCRSGPNSVNSAPIDVVENGEILDDWKGVRVEIKANQAVSCTLVVT